MHKKVRLALLIGAALLFFIVNQNICLAADSHTLAALAQTGVSQKSSTAQAQAAATNVQCGQGGTTGKGHPAAGLRYFAAGMPVGVMQAKASALPKQQVKALLEKEIDNVWCIVQSALGFSTKQKAYAFFLGMASRESTLDAGLETGSGAGHSYGPIQTAETAYADANPSYMPEHNVPEMIQYAFTPQNFYDPGIAVFMGIRHLIHFSRLAKAEGYRGTELLRHALVGYNTGYVDTTDQNELRQYSDEIGAMAGWYLSSGHLYDALFAWTGEPGLNRSQPWAWY
ncbi:MAG TPA: hypothetical protein VKV40_13170 [Ktedonobacteraceae bacterium]|nr:hypothetical protein [Ktedonobacteraceae bacterium]